VNDSTKRVLLGMASGGLVSTGLVCAVLTWFLSRLFIVGLQSPMGILLLFSPVLLVAAGTVFAVRALQVPRKKTLRVFFGMVMVLAPLLVVVALPSLGVLLGSLGMDIHWNGSKFLAGASVLGAAITLCAAFIVGIRLLKVGRA
jgi:hypothetical protein